MKTLPILMGALLAGAVAAHGTPSDGELEAKIVRRVQENLRTAGPEKANRITGRNVTYSGIAVALVKAENKLQLLNPLAPEEYGNAEDSVVRDPVNHKVSGLKIFSIEF
jgi:hypothetical protein